jgi:hyperosmotically inducible protein
MGPVASCERRIELNRLQSRGWEWRGALTLAVTLWFVVSLAGCGGGGRSDGDTSADNRTVGQSQSTSGSADNQAADNTGRNVRDRNDANPTPTDQTESEADRTITQAIRQTVVNSDLSANAKNVKIITQNGVVTLRGPVDSEAEKAFIANAARSAAGVASVDDQLEVVAKSDR